MRAKVVTKLVRFVLCVQGFLQLFFARLEQQQLHLQPMPEAAAEVVVFPSPLPPLLSMCDTSGH